MGPGECGAKGVRELGSGGRVVNKKFGEYLVLNDGRDKLEGELRRRI